MLRQIAAAAFKVSGGDVVEQQCALLEVAAGQRGFNKGLLAAQPVECSIDLLGSDFAQAQHLAQRMAGGGRIQHPRGRQFGRRLEQAGNNQGQRQIAHGSSPWAEGPRRCGARRGSTVSSAMWRAVPSAASTWPCGSARTIPPLRWRAAVWRRATRRAVAQCARRASATSWRGSGFWSCRLRGNSPQQDGRRGASVWDNGHIHAPIESLSLEMST